MDKEIDNSGALLSAEQLEALCQSYTVPHKLASRLSYWTTEVYGIGKYLRRYGYYPQWLPLCVYTDHGPMEHDPPKHELESAAPVQLYHSPNTVKHWQTVSDKPCYCYFSPFVFYRQTHGISVAPGAKGTIAFPAHTTPVIDDVSDIQLYINDLRSLPEEMQPVSVCLHMHDINKGLHRKFMEAGFPVYTAGHASDHDFIERFYAIVRQFKYGTSNVFGSYVFYCVELGIPFSITGAKQRYINKSDPNLPVGEILVDKDKYYREATDLFAGINTTIAPEQRDYVRFHLGFGGAVSRRKMALILYSALLKTMFSLQWLTRVVRRNRSAAR